MKTIQLTQNQVARVDDSDFDALNTFKWCDARDGKTFYALRKVPHNGSYKTVRLHQQIMGGNGFDHEDGDGLNNQRYNLRPANKTQNKANSAKQGGTASVYKGVHRDRNKWRAQITAGVRIHLGCFDLEIDAAKAYDTAAIQHFGEFAKLNFPLDNPSNI